MDSFIFPGCLGIPVEEGVFCLGIQCGRRLVEDQNQGGRPHVRTSEGDSLPLAVRQGDAGFPCHTKLCFKPLGQFHHQTVSSCSPDGSAYMLGTADVAHVATPTDCCTGY